MGTSTPGLGSGLAGRGKSRRAEAWVLKSTAGTIIVRKKSNVEGGAAPHPGTTGNYTAQLKRVNLGQHAEIVTNQGYQLCLKLFERENDLDERSTINTMRERERHKKYRRTTGTAVIRT